MIDYRFEAERTVRAGFVGCGGHSYRNIYPAFRYAPVDLVAVADVAEERAVAYAREFGAQRSYRDYREMLANEDLDCVFVVTNYDDRGRPRFPAIAIDAMRAGCHAWIEKPPAADLAEVEAMMTVEQETGKFVQVGFKKMFTPANEKAREISRRPEFGGVSQLTVRYPQAFPPFASRFDLARHPAAVGLLDHIFHPLSVIQLLGGDATTLLYQRDERAGGVFALLGLRDGGVACLHSVAQPGRHAPLEPVEVVGQGAHLVIENGVHLTYYRPGHPLPYGRAASFVAPDDEAPLRWEPEFSLGVLSNDNAFLLGYVPQVRAFCHSVHSNSPPERAGLRDARQMMRIYEAFRQPAGQIIELAPLPSEGPSARPVTPTPVLSLGETS